MTVAIPIESEPTALAPPVWRWDRRVSVGGGILIFLLLSGLLSLPWTHSPSSNLFYDRQHTDAALKAPARSISGCSLGRRSWGPVCWGNV